MTNWEQTQGTMLSGNIETSSGYDSSTNSYQPYHEPAVTYQYEVGGVQYTGTRVTQHSFRYGSLGDVKKFLADHPVGSTVTVYYDPADPASAVLEKGLGRMANKQLALTGGVFAGVGIFTIAFVGFMVVVICVVTLLILLALGAGGATLYQFLGL